MTVSEWTERGRELGETLGHCNAIVVVGSDVVAAAEVAVAIARVQAANRRVAVADLVGDVPPLQSLVTGDDPHGIVDSFEFGVSLNRIAHSVADAGQLFVMPSGSTPIEHEELLPNPRWKRLSGGFRLEGALLILVAPANAPRLKDLVDATDGLIIVGDAVPPEIPVAQSLAWLRTRKTARPSLAVQAPLATVEATQIAPQRDRRRVFAASIGAAITLGLALLLAWFAYRPLSRTPGPARSTYKPTPAAPPAATILSPDSASVAAKADSARANPAHALVVLNPADSVRAAQWGIVLGQTNAYGSAILDLRGRFEPVPAGTYGFDSRTHVFSLVAGAYSERNGADSLLTQLRERKILAPGAGSVTTLPFAYLVQAAVAQPDLAARLLRYAAKGQPIYALRQPNGSANLYFGAYPSLQQAAFAESSVRDAGIVPTLVYRIGRTF